MVWQKLAAGRCGNGLWVLAEYFLLISSCGWLISDRSQDQVCWLDWCLLKGREVRHLSNTICIPIEKKGKENCSYCSQQHSSFSFFSFIYLSNYEINNQLQLLLPIGLIAHAFALYEIGAAFVAVPSVYIVLLFRSVLSSRTNLVLTDVDPADVAPIWDLQCLGTGCLILASGRHQGALKVTKFATVSAVACLPLLSHRKRKWNMRLGGIEHEGLCSAHCMWHCVGLHWIYKILKNGIVDIWLVNQIMRTFAIYSNQWYSSIQTSLQCRHGGCCLA